MAGTPYTTPSQSIASTSFSGGLNTTGGPLSLEDKESSDLQNIDFNKFGSLLKRNGYVALNTTAIASSPASDGIWWFEYVASGTNTQKAINVAGGNVYKMDGLDGTWDSITGSITATANHHVDFENFLNTCWMTNGYNKPWKWTASGNCTNIPALQANSYTFVVAGYTVAPAVGDIYTNDGETFTITEVGDNRLVTTGTGDPALSGNLALDTGSGDNPIAFTDYTINVNIETAKFVTQYNNYLFLSNVKVDSVVRKSRIYWCAIKDPQSWDASNYIEVSLDDGQEITGVKVLADRLVIYKDRAIYCLYFTGDADIPFIMPGGGKTNSHVGCVSPWSIQEVDNAHIFLAFDGLYLFDGNNSQKLSYRIDKTFDDLYGALFSGAVSLVQKKKNRYWLAVPSGLLTGRDTVIVWDYYNNAFSLYKGLAPSAMATFFVGGVTETPYFGDYAGFVYKADWGANDYPLNTKTAINAYYYTNWRAFGDAVSQKGVPHIYLYYLYNNATVSVSYSYDGDISDQYTLSVDTFGSLDVYGTAVYGTGIYASDGSGLWRLDLTGRGRLIRFKFANASEDGTFRIDGLGQYAHLETFA